MILLPAREPCAFTLIDSHCHLDYLAAGVHGHSPDTNLAVVIAKAAQHGVRYFINPGVSLAEFGRVQAVAETYDPVYFAVSVHPCDVAETEHWPHWLEQVEARLSHPKCVAVGETGLDYFHTAADSQEADLQRTCFRKLLDLAAENELPVIVHDRDAHDDVAEFIDDTPGIRGVMHCFSGDARFALAMAERGFYISFAGNVTFKKAEALRAAAKVVPADRLLVETDSPFLSPMPERGLPNEPYRTRFVAECLAEVRGISLEALAEQTTANAIRLFNLPIPVPA
jgi:TatD DNase family protein